jgi:hypothetical protein
VRHSSTKCDITEMINQTRTSTLFLNMAIWQIIPLSNTIIRHKHCPNVIASLPANFAEHSNNCVKYHGG